MEHSVICCTRRNKPADDNDSGILEAASEIYKPPLTPTQVSVKHLAPLSIAQRAAQAARVLVPMRLVQLLCSL